jgi:hypothetical protein
MTLRVANLLEATAVLSANPAPEIELWSPENAAEIQGVLWFVMLRRALQSAFPDRNTKLVLDCGSRGDLAIEAFRQGLQDVALTAPAPVTAKVTEIAKTCGGRLISNPTFP